MGVIPRACHAVSIYDTNLSGVTAQIYEKPTTCTARVGLRTWNTSKAEYVREVPWIRIPLEPRELCLGLSDSEASVHATSEHSIGGSVDFCVMRRAAIRRKPRL
jgi:hypothetical protein